MKFSYLVSVLGASLVAGCAPSVYYVVPRDLASSAKRDSITQLYRPALDGRTIFLDPGHGGEDRVNRGPEGDAIEADVNLRVGLSLREFLSAAGARVIMSRDKDTSIALADRPLMAARSGAEIFVSIHHNATGSADPITNYGSVYYHSRPGLRDYHPANQDLARHLQRDMSYAMRNPGPPFSPTFDGTLSDFDIYPNSGFAVLRENPLPSVLIESSFFTHPPEEQRLAVPEFNRIEAWGIFLGLGKYFRSGFPGLTLQSDTIVTVARPVFSVSITPWEDLDRKSVDVSLNDVNIPGIVSDSTRTLLVTPLQDLRSGLTQLTVSVRTRGGKSSWPFRKRITVMLPASTVTAQLRPDTIPPVPGAASRLVCSARDSNGDPVADGCMIRVYSSAPGIDTTLRTVGGSAICYVTAPAHDGSVPLEVQCQHLTTAVTLIARQDSLLYVSGMIRAADSALTLAEAQVSVRTHDFQCADTTWPDGRFVLHAPSSEAESLHVGRDGYFPSTIPLRGLHETNLTIQLRPVAARKLFGRTILIDPRYGGSEDGESSARGIRSADINLEIAYRLTELLQAAGANAHLVRSTDTTIAEADRIRRSADFPRGIYMRIDAGQPGTIAVAEIYRSISNRRLAEQMLAALASYAHLDTTGVKPSNERFFNDVAMGTISIRLPSAATGFYDSTAARVIDRIAWCLFGGILHDAGFIDPSPTIFRYAVGTPSVSLGGVFWQIPDLTGAVYFFGLDQLPH